MGWGTDAGRLCNQTAARSLGTGPDSGSYFRTSCTHGYRFINCLTPFFPIHAKTNEAYIQCVCVLSERIGARLIVMEHYASVVVRWNAFKVHSFLNSIFFKPQTSNTLYYCSLMS